MQAKPASARGQVGLIAGTMLAIAIFAGQCALAALWLRFFHFGPIEWIWRRASYGAPIALLRSVSPKPGAQAFEVSAEDLQPAGAALQAASNSFTRPTSCSIVTGFDI